MSSKTKTKQVITKDEKNLINLTTGKKEPLTEKEKRMSKDIATIKEKGGEVHIPHD